MQAKQLSVFIENREGRLDEVLAVIKAANVNIMSLSLADTSEYGLLRLIVSDPAKADAALKANGFSSMLTDVLVVRLDNKVGSLQSFLAALAKTDINLEYIPLWPQTERRGPLEQDGCVQETCDGRPGRIPGRRVYRRKYPGNACGSGSSSGSACG